MVMTLKYDRQADAAAVLVNGEIGPNDTADVRQLDCDRIVRYSAQGRAIEYQFLNVHRFGVRIDDLDDRDALQQLFRRHQIPERDWSEPIMVKAIRRRRDIAAG